MKTTQKFYKMPQALFSDKFSQLSNDAKILYMLLLNRKSLSEKNDFNDENGNTVVLFSNLEVCRSIGCGHDKATAMFRELEEYQLIHRRKQGKVHIMEEKDRLIDTKEVAKVLGCSLPTARRIMQREDFPLIRVGKNMKVSPEALREWMKNRRV